MTEINGDTVITMTWKQLFGGVVLLFGGLWMVLTFTMGNLRDDVSDIRGAVTTAQDRNGDLRAEIAGLTAELRATNSELSNLSASVSGLNDSIRTVDVRLSRSVERQEAFERSVLIRLGPVGVDRTNYTAPMTWGESQGEILGVLSKGEDPLTDWYKLTTQP